MLTLAYGFYILVWPVVTLVMMVLICGATIKDMRNAKRDNNDVV